MGRDPTRSDVDDEKGPAQSPDENKGAELFDDAARLRFGKMISEAASKPIKRRRKSPP
jgi:hypothetical protein